VRREHSGLFKASGNVGLYLSNLSCPYESQVKCNNNTLWGDHLGRPVALECAQTVNRSSVNSQNDRGGCTAGTFANQIKKLQDSITVFSLSRFALLRVEAARRHRDNHLHLSVTRQTPH
jgi:hypothetical protein